MCVGDECQQLLKQSLTFVYRQVAENLHRGRTQGFRQFAEAVYILATYVLLASWETFVLFLDALASVCCTDVEFRSMQPGGAIVLSIQSLHQRILLIEACDGRRRSPFI